MRSFATLTCLALAAAAFGPTATASAASPAPFSRLFLTPLQRTNERPVGLWKDLPTVTVGLPTAAVAGGTPRVVCGTIVVLVGREFDAKIRRQAPLDPKPSARTRPAPSCQHVK